MRNKGFVILLTFVITALCLYYLSFTFVSRGIQQDAIAYATDENGVVDLSKKQAYLDSVWSKPVYNLFGVEFTYKEVKDNELNLGLDLQGGMHVTLEISPSDLIKGLSGNSNDPAFNRALDKAREMQKTSAESFTTLFLRAFKEENPSRGIASIFATASNRGKVSVSDTDESVILFLDKEIDEAIDRSFTILRTRIDQFGTSQPNIQRLPGTGRIQIEIPGADNPQRVRKLLQGVAQLNFWEVVEVNDIYTQLLAINDMLVKEQNAKRTAQKADPLKSEVKDQDENQELSELEKQLLAAGETDEADQTDSLSAASLSPLFAKSLPPGFAYDVRDTMEINRIFARKDVQAMLPRTLGFFWDAKPNKDAVPGREVLTLNFVDIGRSGKAKLTGEVITDARQDFDEYARPSVSMTMNAAGTKTWRKMTADASNKNPKGRIAIVLDNYVYSAPTVINEIPNGNSQITGNFTIEEAKDLANILKAGALPAPTRIVEQAIVGPTLGKVALNQGLISMLSGLAIVVIFMVAYYAKGGLVANLALVFNIFFVLGILAQLKSALTLPGIAGIVLTMGMAVDANVLIFERIREELRHGAKLKEAVSLGYQKAYSSIFDSNVTTFLTALMLYWLGQGPIKGFAITLMVGIATSFFSAVYISRVVVEYMTRKGDDSKVSFITPLSSLVASELKIDFIGLRKKAYIFSASVIVIGMALTFAQGLNLGVDFKGGRAYIVSFSKPVVATEMKVALSRSFEGAGTEVKNYGSNNVVKVTTAWLIEEDSDEADDKVKEALVSGLESHTGLKFIEDDTKVDDQHFSIGSSNKVSATIADDIKKSSVEAGIFSILVIFLYIFIRFRKWQFSSGAIIAIVHDILFVFAVFAISRVLGIQFEIDQVFIAALLTIIGYSINDTVIIFDRIRENLGLGLSADRVKIFNTAINSTLNRTLITSGTTLVVVTVLMIFGGEVLRGFSFALFVGILIGTYSSIFIAAPTVLELDKKNLLDKVPEKAPVTA
ncbi:MAG TPA: protein translocase subunit SecDF [Cyclobacteriaceae bacterium]|nr:protein translocase subunit SecDF [Cyclobacteriaceae bacterium]